MADAQEPKPEPKQPAGEHGFVVGADDVRLAKLFDGVQQAAEQGNRRLVRQPLQSDCQAGMMFTDTENRVLMLLGVGDLGQVDAPVFAFRHIVGRAVPDLAAQHTDVVTMLLDRLRHKGFADGFTPVGKQPIEGDRQGPAAGVGQMGLEADEFVGDPGWFAAGSDGVVFPIGTIPYLVFSAKFARLFVPDYPHPQQDRENGGSSIEIVQ